MDSKKTAGIWNDFKAKHPGVAQFLVFFIFSNGITVLQVVLMPLFKSIFALTELVDTSFQVFQIGQNLDGTQYFIFNYGAGSLAEGGGGGLAYFLAVQITLLIAQIINFFLQRNITFKSNTSIWRAAFWYVLAYIAITLLAGAAQGLYKVPIYNLFINSLGMGAAGETVADVITMVINSAISFWVFFPIFKLIFKQEKEA